MRTWIWPISWYLRIRRLEAEVASLKVRNRELDSMLRAAAMQNTVQSIAYVSAMASISSAIGGNDHRLKKACAPLESNATQFQQIGASVLDLMLDRLRDCK